MEQMDQMKRLSTLGQAGFLAISRQTADRFEALCKKQLELGLGCLRGGIDDLESLFAVTDVDGLARWGTNHAQAGLGRLALAMREQAVAAFAAQDELKCAVQEQIAAVNRETAAILDGLAGGLPGGAQPFTEVMGAMAAATNEAFDSIARMSGKFGDEWSRAITGGAGQQAAALPQTSSVAA